jgi:hypothetical protein
MGTTPTVIGFVPIRAADGGYQHVPGHTIRMRWPGTAESWLDGLVRTGFYSAWRATDASAGEPSDYRGARVFHCTKTARKPATGPATELLVAVWEGPF